MDHQTNAVIVELENQRNVALANCATKSGQLAVAYNEIKELREQVKALEEELREQIKALEEKLAPKKADEDGADKPND